VKAGYYARHASESVTDGLTLTEGTADADSFNQVLNKLGSLPNARVLDVGTETGSSLLAIIRGNTLRAVGIGVWSDYAASALSRQINVHKGDSTVFLANGDCWTAAANQSEQLVANLNGQADIFHFRSQLPNNAMEYFMALTSFIKLLDATFIYIVSDWNMPAARDGTNLAISVLRLNICYLFEVSTAGASDNTDTSQSVWNGVAIFVLSRNASGLTEPQS
jgi:hypothetical protein